MMMRALPLLSVLLLCCCCCSRDASAFFFGAPAGAGAGAGAGAAARPAQKQAAKAVSAGILGAWVLIGGGVGEALADGSTTKFALPPINRTTRDRCTFKSSAMGQANAARDSLYDLRECNMRCGVGASLESSGRFLYFSSHASSCLLYQWEEC
jgi:hypothetical protein